jgi:hypothetical protein
MPDERREVLGADRTRAPRAWVTLLGVAVVAAAAVVTMVRGHEGPAPSPRRPSPSMSRPPAVTGPPWGLVPAAHGEGGRTSLRLVFPDGSTAEMSYPAALRLAELGVRPHAAAYLAGGAGTGAEYEDCCFRPVFAPPVGAAWFARGGPSTGELPGADGAWVSVVPPPSGGPVSPYLVFTFGSWHVGVQTRRDDGMGAVREESWAANLHGSITAEGFLVLRGTGPLRLTMPPDERPRSRGGATSGRPHGGPQLRFGRGMMPGYTIGSYEDRVVILEPVSHCRESAEASGYLEVAIADSSCKGSSMRVWAAGDREFVQAVLRDVRIWNIRRASR